MFAFFCLCFILLGDLTCFDSKVVRRASLSDRHNLCRKEYETEAIVWRGGREEEVKEKESDQENNQVFPIHSFSANWNNFCCLQSKKSEMSEWMFVGMSKVKSCRTSIKA